MRICPIFRKITPKKVVVPDMKAYDRFLHEVVFRIPGVSSIRTNVVLREVKYETALPIG